MSTIEVVAYRRYARIDQYGIRMYVLPENDPWWSPERLETHPDFLGWKDLEWQYDEVQAKEAQS